MLGLAGALMRRVLSMNCELMNYLSMNCESMNYLSMTPRFVAVNWF
jgi:hypothetical protein